MTALREDLEVSLDTVRRWFAMLGEIYYLVLLRPWTKRVARSLQKEAKLYLCDWSDVEAERPRFENMVALHLINACDYWSDVGLGGSRAQAPIAMPRKQPTMSVRTICTDNAPERSGAQRSDSTLARRVSWASSLSGRPHPPTSPSRRQACTTLPT
jgi:hypothetical protein